MKYLCMKWFLRIIDYEHFLINTENELFEGASYILLIPSIRNSLEKLICDNCKIL